MEEQAYTLNDRFIKRNILNHKIKAEYLVTVNYSMLYKGMGNYIDIDEVPDEYRDEVISNIEDTLSVAIIRALLIYGIDNGSDVNYFKSYKNFVLNWLESDLGAKRILTYIKLDKLSNDAFLTEVITDVVASILKTMYEHTKSHIEILDFFNLLESDYLENEFVMHRIYKNNILSILKF